MTASGHFNLAADLFAGRVADPRHPGLRVVTGNGTLVEEWSHSDLAAAIFAVAGGFADLGLPPGTKVLMRIGNVPTFPLLFFGAIAAGLVPIPTSTHLTTPEADFILEDSSAGLVLGDGSGAMPSHRDGVRFLDGRSIGGLFRGRPLAAPAETRADDPAFMIYTSGTSGRPKGVVHAQRVIRGRHPMRVGWTGLTGSDRMLHAGAFNWTYTLGVGLMDPWLAGATAIIHLSDAERPPEIWPDLIENAQATMFAAVPGLYRRILKYGRVGRDRFSALRHALTAGEALKAALHAEWTDRTGRPLYEALGMSEISTYVSSGPDVPTRPGSPGRPQPGRRVAVLPIEGGTGPVSAGRVGVLAVHRSDPGLMLGYHGRPAETAAVFRGDWFITGDLARFDEDGYLWYEGRADDQMNAFGYRVAPEEVERAIAGHPGVGDVAVAVTRSGEIDVITAFVVPHEGADPSVLDLDAHVGTLVADYKRPRRWIFVDALPRTASGKVLRRRLAAEHSA